MNDILIIVGMVILVLVALFIIPQWRLKRTIPKVIQTFREEGALDMKHAKTPDELGFKPRGMLQQIIYGRDYKKYALTYLMNAGIVLQTEDDKLYLSEQGLIESGIDSGTYYR